MRRVWVSKSATRRTHLADEEDSHKPCVNEDGYKVAVSRVEIRDKLMCYFSNIIRLI